MANSLAGPVRCSRPALVEKPSVESRCSPGPQGPDHACNLRRQAFDTPFKQVSADDRPDTCRCSCQNDASRSETQYVPPGPRCRCHAAGADRKFEPRGRGWRRCQKRELSEPAGGLVSALRNGVESECRHVLNLNSRISPSLTIYSLPSSRALPASFAAVSPPRVT